MTVVTKRHLIKNHTTLCSLQHFRVWFLDHLRRLIQYGKDSLRAHEAGLEVRNFLCDGLQRCVQLSQVSHDHHKTADRHQPSLNLSGSNIERGCCSKRDNHRHDGVINVNG